MLNLWWITFDECGEQFLVNAPNIEMAVDKAIEANHSLGEIWEDEDDNKCMDSRSFYDVETVDMFLLSEIARRDDYVRKYKDVIIYNG